MPDAANPQMGPWVKTLARAVSESEHDTYLVGHSLGCIAILRYLESPSCGGELSSFFNTPLDWERIRNHCEKFVSIHSDNDGWVDVSNSDLFASNLKAKTLIRHNMGHFSGSDGVTELPGVLDELNQLMEAS